MAGRARIWSLSRPGVLTFLYWEWLLQARTLRFRIGVAAYLALVSLPALVVYLGDERLFGGEPGPVTYLTWTQMAQVLLSVVFGCVLGGNRTGSRDREEMWPVLAASPLTNAGYGLRRSVALAMLLLPITLAGTATAAGLATAAGAPPTSITRWLVVWLLLIYIPAALSAAAWRTLVSASGSEMAAALVALVGIQVVSRLSLEAKKRSGLGLGLTDEVFGFSSFRWAAHLVARFNSGQDWFEGVASEAPFDAEVFVALWWQSYRVGLGLILAVALAVPLWLGRTRRDLPPLRLHEDHWLRSLGPKIYGFLQRLVPDAGLREIRWLPLLMLSAAAIPLWLHARHGAWAFDQAEHRFAAEQAGGDMPTTDTALVVTRWRSEGTLSPDELDLRWSAEFWLPPGEMTPPTETLQLAFTFDPHLELRAPQVHRIDESGRESDAPWSLSEAERHWDRWLVQLTPRPAPGERFRLSAGIGGRPIHVKLGVDVPGAGASFSVLFDEYQRRGRAFRRSDFSETEVIPLITNRGIDLDASTLGPVPRHSTWELTPKPVLPGDPGWHVPMESSSAASRLELDLTFRSDPTLEDRVGWFTTDPPLVVASSCGGWSNETEDGHAGGPVVLTDSCDMPAHELRILGGRWVRLDEAPVVAAASPRHREKLESMLPEIRQVVAASAEAWPGYPGIDRLVVVEQPARLALNGRRNLLRLWQWDRPQSLGRMVRFWERHMAGEGQLDPAAILDGILGAEVASSRLLHPDQRYMLRSLLSSLMKLRMGVARHSAVLGEGMPQWRVVQLKRPLLGLHPYEGLALAQKVPAVVLQLERRVGMDPLVAAVAEFLARTTEERATAEELFELLEQHSGQDLDGFFDDYFVSGSLPELSLVDVRVVPRRGGFRVTGAVANAVGGEVQCPVVLRTDGPELRWVVDVPGQGRGEFSFDVEARPQVAILDPDGTCLRLFGGGGRNAERVSLQ